MLSFHQTFIQTQGSHKLKSHLRPQQTKSICFIVTYVTIDTCNLVIHRITTYPIAKYELICTIFAPKSQTHGWNE
jgi:hypothetical protein